MRVFGLMLLGLSLVGCSSSEDRTTGGGPGTGGSNGWTDNSGGNGGIDGNSGVSLPPGVPECGREAFSAGLSRGANIVWVIDTSGSMKTEAALVQDNMNRFVQALVGLGLEDYRVVVVSEKQFVSVPAPLGTDTQKFLFVEEKVGSNEPLEALLSRYDDFGGFLLPGALTHYVSVTDDESDISATDFISAMEREMDGASFRVHAVASPPGATSANPAPTFPWDDDDDDDGCTGVHGNAAAAGTQHFAAASATGGLTFSICEADWSGLFSALATEVGQSANVPCDFAIPMPSGEDALDPFTLNVVLTNAEGRTLTLQHTDSAQCHASGFSHNDPNNPTRIVLCPEACKAANQAKQLDVVFGCAPTVE